jgi:hypothetical protein
VDKNQIALAAALALAVAQIELKNADIIQMKENRLNQQAAALGAFRHSLWKLFLDFI